MHGIRFLRRNGVDPFAVPGSEDDFLAARRLSDQELTGRPRPIRPSDGALVDVAPSRGQVLEQDDDGMVGFFVVCFGVLAG